MEPTIWVIMMDSLHIARCKGRKYTGIPLLWLITKNYSFLVPPREIIVHIITVN